MASRSLAVVATFVILFLSSFAQLRITRWATFLPAKPTECDRSRVLAIRRLFAS